MDNKEHWEKVYGTKAPDQKAFLIEAKAEDSEWSEVVDQLANLLIQK